MFDQHYLEECGFTGFTPLLGSDLARTAPHGSGVYAVLVDASEYTPFLTRSRGGRFKDKDPTVDHTILLAKLVPGAETAYIGRATSIDRRLSLLARFGQGEPVAHWGGRYLWQVSRPEQLRVAWRLDIDPVQAEADLLDDFERAFGQLPFANLVRGSRAVARL